MFEQEGRVDAYPMDTATTKVEDARGLDYLHVGSLFYCPCRNYAQ